MSFEELEKRILFCNKQIDILFTRLDQFDKAVATHEEDLCLASRSMDGFEDKIRELKAIQRQESKIRRKRRLQLIRNNLQSITRQLKARDPEPYVPVEQWEAFQEFLSKLNLNHKRPKATKSASKS